MPDDRFVRSPSGSLDFGYLSEGAAKSIRRQPGPLRLQALDLRHIEERHSREILQDGYSSALEFVHLIAESYNAIYKGERGSLFLVVDLPETRAKSLVAQLSPALEGSEDFWAIKTATVLRRSYLKGKELLLWRNSPYHTPTPGEAPFSVRPEAVEYSVGDPMADVNIAEVSNHIQEKPTMAAQLDHLLSYGPMDVVASNDEKQPGLHIVHVDAETSAFIPQDDPLHQEIRNLIDKNPHSKGFVANQIQARLEQEGRWAGPGHDTEGVSFGPSLNPEREMHEIETFPAQNVDLPDYLKAALNPRVELRPMVLRDGSRLAPKAMEPGDKLVGYVVNGKADPLPGADLGESNIFPGKQQRFGLDELDNARQTAQAIAQGTVITFDTLEAGFKERTGYNFEERYFSGDGQKQKHLEQWEAQKAQHVAIRADEVGVGEPALPDPGKAVEAEAVDKTGKNPDPEPQQKAEPAVDPLADWPGASQKSLEPLMLPEKPRFERKNPPEVLFANPKGKPYVLDHGDKVTVTNRAMLGLGHEAAEKRQKAVEIGLKAAVDRFGEPVRFQGNRVFLEETVKVAMERGIKLEPGSPMAKEIYERATREHGNQLGPSKAAPYRAPEKKREVDKGKGLGL